MTSPSGKNIKPWELILVTDKELLSQLSQSRGSASRPLADAALAIVIVADPSLTDIWIEDSSIISTIIQLTAESIGLGSCWIQVREIKDSNGLAVEDLVNDTLKIPSEFKVESMIAIGYPDEEKKSHNIEGLPFDKVHYNTY